ncbi:MAG: hypothetical protein IJ507_01490 [Clostridia bacterium]|nr:hypothetical protein [Clostridia bacterium]
MYTEQDLIAIRAQQKKRWLTLAVPCMVLLCGLIASLVVRVEWLTSLITIIIGVILIAGYDLFIRPLHRYDVFLRNALHGLVRETQCEYHSITRTEERVEGVLCRTMTVIEYEDDGQPYERIFYFDALKPFPQLEQGQKLRVRFHDRSVVALECI